MAGTRLAIISTFLGPFLIWTLLSVGIGLRKEDMLWRRALTFALGRDKMRRVVLFFGKATTTTTANILWDIPITTSDDLQHLLHEHQQLRIVTDAIQIESWVEAAIQQIPIPIHLARDDVGNTINELRNVCTEPDVIQSMESNLLQWTMWICESEPQTRMVLTQYGNVIVYPSRTQPTKDLQSILLQQQQQQHNQPDNIHPFAERSTQRRWHLNVQLDRTIVEWNNVIQKVDQWMVQRQDRYKNCLDANWNLQLAESTLEEFTGIHPVLSTESVVRAINLQSSPPPPHAILCITSVEGLVLHASNKQEPTLASNATSKIGLVGEDGTLLVIAYPSDSIGSVLDHLLEHILIQCWRIPTFSNIIIEGKNTLFFEKLASYQKVVNDRQMANDKVIQVQRMLRELPPAVPLSSATLKKFALAIENLHSMQVGLVSIALSLLTDLSTDPILSEPSDMPSEHYMAIFAPLLFPLLVPMLLTLFREYKRYDQKLRTKKINEEKRVPTNSTSNHTKSYR